MSVLIKDIPKNERPRERLINHGVMNLSNEELLAIILKTGTKNTNVKILAQNVLKQLKNINDLSSITKDHLMQIRGIGETKAIEILAAIELGKRVYQIKDSYNGIIYNNAQNIYDFNKYLFLNTQQECFYVLYLNNKNHLIERKLLFMGTVNRSIVHPREVFKNAYLLSACSIVCIHNHPSGDISPSQEDIFFTNSLIESGKVLGINVLDHIIFGNNEFYSFYDNNKLKG